MDHTGLNLGARIREARRQRHLTLERLAEKSRLSIGFLSQVERDITRPSLGSLARIASSLDLPVSALLHLPDLPNAISRAEGRGLHVIPPDGLAFEQLSTTFPGQLLRALKLRVPPGYRGTTPPFEGELVVYALKGTIRYILDGTIYELEPGDAFHFSAMRGYEISNPNDSAAEVLAIGTEPLDGSHLRLLPDRPPRPNGGDEH